MQKPENFDGIFIGDKPLNHHLIDEERDDKSRQIEDIRKESEKKKKFSVVYKSEKQPLPETRRVAKRVKRYTDKQIRKEYGIMAKPYETHHANAIWCIIEKGPISTKDIGAEIEWAGDKSSLSAAVSTVWKSLGTQHAESIGLIERQKHGMSFLYKKKADLDMSVDAVIDRFNITRNKQWRKEKAAKKQVKNKKVYRQVQTAKKVTKPEKVEPASQEKPIDSQIYQNGIDATALNIASDMVVDAIEKNKISANTNLKADVNFHGRVDVIFSWKPMHYAGKG